MNTVFELRQAVLLGCLLLGVAAGCAPILAFQYSDSVRARRWLAFLAAAGALLVMLRPPLPTKVCSRSLFIRALAWGFPVIYAKPSGS